MSFIHKRITEEILGRIITLFKKDMFMICFHLFIKIQTLKVKTSTHFKNGNEIKKSFIKDDRPKGLMLKLLSKEHSSGFLLFLIN